MADEAIGEAAAATAAEGGAVILVPNPEAEAAEHPSEPEPPDVLAALAATVGGHEDRLRMLEARQQLIDNEHVAIRTTLDSKADASHEHPTDEDVRIVAEELRALREEEVAPRRAGLIGIQRGWLRRKLRGQSA